MKKRYWQILATILALILASCGPILPVITPTPTGTAADTATSLPLHTPTPSATLDCTGCEERGKP